MADFREVLEISRDKEIRNRLCYSWCKTKYDLCDEPQEGELEAPPIEIDFDMEVPIGEIADMVDQFCASTFVARAKLRSLLECGNQRVRIVEEY